MRRKIKAQKLSNKDKELRMESLTLDTPTLNPRRGRGINRTRGNYKPPSPPPPQEGKILRLSNISNPKPPDFPTSEGALPVVPRASHANPAPNENAMTRYAKNWGEKVGEKTLPTHFFRRPFPPRATKPESNWKGKLNPLVARLIENIWFTAMI